MGWGCVSEKPCLQCANLDVELICGNRTCMKTAFVFTSFSIRADVGDLRTCWRIFVAKRSSVKSFRFGIIATTFSMMSHIAL